MIRFKWGLILFLVSILLSGCGENPAESVYHQLEAAVELEIPFEQQQAPLQKAELRENELFEQIIGLGMDEYEEIETLANEALESAQAREAMLQLEKESIEESFEQFQKVKKEVENIDQEELNSVLEELIEAMNDRYNHYQTLYDHYEDAITLDKQLFEMLKDEELTMEILQEQIDEVNEAYEKVSDSKQQFNESTDAYNELKREFYSKAELNVQFD